MSCHRFFTTKNSRSFCNSISALKQSLGTNMFLMSGGCLLMLIKLALKLFYFTTVAQSLLWRWHIQLLEIYKNSFRSNWILEVFLKYLWKFEGDFPAAWPTAGLQKAYIFFCLWNCLDDSNPYTKTIWYPQEELADGRNNVMHTPLIDLQKVCLPPLHLQLRISLLRIYERFYQSNGSSWGRFPVLVGKIWL